MTGGWKAVHDATPTPGGQYTGARKAVTPAPRGSDGARRQTAAGYCTRKLGRAAVSGNGVAGAGVAFF
jgi:hypothetical protein